MLALMAYLLILLFVRTGLLSAFRLLGLFIRADLYSFFFFLFFLMVLHYTTLSFLLTHYRKAAVAEFKKDNEEFDAGKRKPEPRLFLCYCRVI